MKENAYQKVNEDEEKECFLKRINETKVLIIKLKISLVLILTVLDCNIINQSSCSHLIGTLLSIKFRNNNGGSIKWTMVNKYNMYFYMNSIMLSNLKITYYSYYDSRANRNLSFFTALLVTGY